MDESLDFLIVGGQRALSTRLNDLVRAHPQLSSPRGEVVYFEDPWFGERNISNNLASVLGPRKSNVLRGFKRADLLARPECPQRIAVSAPDVRLVVTVREPISRTISAYHHLVRTGCLPLLPMNEGLRRILRHEFTEEYPLAQELITAGMYGTHIDRYLQYFDRSQIRIVVDDEFYSDPESTIRSVYEHIGVDPSFVPEALYRRANEGVYNPIRLRVLRMGSRFLYYRRGPYVLARQNRLARAANRIPWLVDRLLLAPFLSKSKPVLQPDLAARLAETFRPDIETLEGLIGRPIPTWYADSKPGS